MCDFCAGFKPVPYSFIGYKKANGNFIVRDISSIPSDYDPENFDDSIVLVGNLLFWDNSCREYSMEATKIRYCPFCGDEIKELEGWEE